MLFKDYGKSSEDPGRSFFFTLDHETKKEVRIWVRMLPLDMEENFKKRYLKRIRNRQTGQRDWIMDERKALDFLLDRVTWMWTDAENLEIEIADDEASQFYLREGVTGANPGAVVTLDGRLTDAIKRRVASRAPQLAEFIIERALEIREMSEAEEADQGKG